MAAGTLTLRWKKSVYATSGVRATTRGQIHRAILSYIVVKKIN